MAALTAANRRYQQGTDALDQAASEVLGINRTDARCVDMILAARPRPQPGS